MDYDLKNNCDGRRKTEKVKVTIFCDTSVDKVYLKCYTVVRREIYMSISDNKKRIAISLTEEQLKKLEKIADDLGVNKSSAVSFLIARYMEERK